MAIVESRRLPVFRTFRSYGTEKNKTIISTHIAPRWGAVCRNHIHVMDGFIIVITRNSKQKENTGEEVKFAY